MVHVTDTHTLRLADETELLGEYQSPGTLQPQQLVRRPDGQLVHLPPLLYAVAASLDGARSFQEVADHASGLCGRDLSAENVSYLIETKLDPAGLLATEEPRALPHASPVLGLRFRIGLVPERLHRAVTLALRPLFRLFIVVPALAALGVVDVYLYLHRREVVDAGRQVLYRPQLLLLVSALAIASAIFHETGHATAARFGGATPGVMGAGVYLIWPVFFTDVTDSYRLDRRGRLRTDLGGVYFNVLFIVSTAVVYLASGYEPLLVFLVFAQLETLQQFLPFVRLDGYYVVSDLVGVPNLFVYMRPVLILLTRQAAEADRRAAQAKLANLKPWARRTVRAWVFLTAPILLLNLVVFLVFGPAIAGAAWGSIQRQAGDAWAAVRDGQIAAILNGVVGLVLLGAPVAGMLYVAVRCAAPVARSVRQWRRRRPVLVTTGGLVISAALLLQLGVVWPRTFSAALERARVESPAIATAPPRTAPASAGPVIAPTAPTSSRPAASPVTPVTSAAPPPEPAAAVPPPPPAAPPPPPAAAPPPPAPTPDAAGPCPPPRPAADPRHPDRVTWMQQLACMTS